jgi:hypothetical protein
MGAVVLTRFLFKYIQMSAVKMDCLVIERTRIRAVDRAPLVGKDELLHRVHQQTLLAFQRIR